MSHRSMLLALALASAVPTAVRAQAPAQAPNPYRILSIGRETVKPGKSGTHDKMEEEWAHALANGKMPYGFLAITSMTGARENWYISGYPTYTEYAKAAKAFSDNPALMAAGKRFDPQESDLLSDSRGMMLVLREDLSYGSAVDMAPMRVFSISRISVRPGHGLEFEEARKLTKQAHETAHLTDSYSIYEATAGAPAGTFFVFVSRKSIAELDDAPRIHNAEYDAALGGDEGRKKMAAMAANYLISSQTDLYSFLPAQSVVSAKWAASDPTYWKLRATPMAP